jgi:hypothetical protein
MRTAGRTVLDETKLVDGVETRIVEDVLLLLVKYGRLEEK